MLMLILLSGSAEQLHPTNPVTAVDDIINMLWKLLSHCKRVEFTITKPPICNIRVKPLIKCWDLPGMSFRSTSYEQQPWKCTKRSCTLLSDCCTKWTHVVFTTASTRGRKAVMLFEIIQCCNHILHQMMWFRTITLLQLNIYVYMCYFLSWYVLKCNLE